MANYCLKILICIFIFCHLHSETVFLRVKFSIHSLNIYILIFLIYTFMLNFCCLIKVILYTNSCHLRLGFLNSSCDCSFSSRFFAVGDLLIRFNLVAFINDRKSFIMSYHCLDFLFTSYSYCLSSGSFVICV